MSDNATRVRQVKALALQEFRALLFARRALWVYGLALLPALICLLAYVKRTIYGTAGETMAADTEVLAGIYQLYYLRVALVFACMGIFMRMFAGEMQERTLHYRLLLPVRREVLVIGKWLAGALTVTALFAIGVTLCSLLLFLSYGAPGRAFLLSTGLQHLGAYLTVTALAALAYGALFLLLGMLLRNPVIPVVLLLTWENINTMLPSALKKLSILFYLKPLLPVEIPITGPLSFFTIVAEPVATWQAILGLLVLSAACLSFAAYRSRSLQIAYTSD